MKTDYRGLDSAKFITKREFAAEAIQRAIQNGSYQPGEIVSQRRISEDLNLSVTPIREAIIQLAAMGVIERHSHHSIKVKDVDAARLRDIYHTRLLLELDATRIAFPNIRKSTIAELKLINAQLKDLLKSSELDKINSLDRQFHYVVFSQSKSEPLVTCIEFIKSSFSSYGLWRKRGRLALSIAEHSNFIAQLEAGNMKGTIEAHRKHLESGLKAALSTASTKVKTS